MDTPPASLEHEEAHVWTVPIDRVCERWEAHWAVLSSDERHRARQFRLDEARGRFVAGRAALRMLVARYLNVAYDTIELATDASGKPRLAGLHHTVELRFNIAHSGELALVALTLGCEVGVDVERLRNVSHANQIAWRFFHPAEIDALAAATHSDLDAMFMRIWTGKEAVLKAAGSGITGSLAGFRVPTDEHEGVWIELPPTRYWLRPLAPAPDYVAAVAFLNAQRTVRCFEFEV